MGQVVVVTGAGTGIGRAVARAFLERGDSVALLGRREAPLLETAGGLPNALAALCDVSREDQVAQAFDTTVRAFGRVDVLFNNAGLGAFATTIDEMPLADWRAVVDVNLTGVFICAREAFRRMRGQDPQGGRIINNGSISAHAPRPGSAAYTATKHAVTGLTKSISLDGRALGIACGQIDIGNALTDLARPLSTGAMQPDGSLRPEPTMDVEDVARAVLYMASLPLSANVLSMTVMATTMPFVGRG